MDCYNSFARVYDELMDNIPYREWVCYILELLKEYGIEDGLVAELGCGTGNITELLSEAGYDMIGIDNSEDMQMKRSSFTEMTAYCTFCRIWRNLSSSEQ